MTQTPIQYPGLGVEVMGQRTHLIVPHKDGKIAFLHPPYGPNTYPGVGLAIGQNKLGRPTMAETASLVHAASNSPKDNRYSAEIMDIMRVRQAWLWGFTGTLYLPKEEAFIQDDPEIRGGRPFMNLDDLVRKLNAKDPSVRHVPFGYKVGEMSPSELAKNPYVIGLAGEEGAEKLARVAEKYSLKPYLASFESVKEPQTRFSGLDSSGSFPWLVVGGYGLGVNWVGYAFALLRKTSGASHAKQ